MNPADVPDALVEAAARALRDHAHDCDGSCGRAAADCYRAHPINWSGLVAGETRIEGEAPDVARAVLTAVLTEARHAWFVELFGDPAQRLDVEQQADDRDALARRIEEPVRAKVAADLQRAAAGRRDYATRAPAHIAAELEAEARIFDTAAKVATAPREVMWGLLPADMWTDADRPERGDT
ncbi:hypothetical protein ACQEU3_46990 [Spirillospora sp. CA-253888]